MRSKAIKTVRNAGSAVTPFRRFRLIVVALATLILGAGVFYFKRRLPPPPPKVQEAWNLVLISIDTVRTDDLQIYNARGVPTPGLNSLAVKGMTFTNAISQAPYTFPSHATMLTGTYPMFHRVQENARARLQPSAVTLAEVLRNNGYKSAAFVGSIVLGSSTRINQGFDVFDESFTLADARVADLAGVQRNGDQVYEAFSRWHSSAIGKYFAFVHIYDPHSPYDPPESFKTSDPSQHGLYRGELQYADSIVDRIIHELPLANTLVVLTGDHGEMFGEHGEIGHGYFVYQPVLKVPLVIAFPGQHSAGKRSDAIVSLVDLMPTLLDLLGIAIPPEVQGIPFTDVLREETTESRPAFSESLTGTRFFRTMPLRSVQDGRYKYIDTPEPELYDLGADASENRNLCAERPDIAARMKTQAADFVRKFSSSTHEKIHPVSPEEQEQLAALGYLSGSSDASGDPSRDVKQFVESWTDLNRLSGLVRQQPEEALTLVRRLRDADADSTQVRIFEARALTYAGKPSRAIPLLEAILAKEPGNDSAWSTLAEAHERNNDADRAARCYRKLAEIQTSPVGLRSFAKHMVHLKKEKELLDYLEKNEPWPSAYDEAAGEAYVRLAQYDRAASHLRKAIAGNAGPSSYVYMSMILESQGDVSGAIMLMEGAGTRFIEVDFQLRLATLYHKTGRVKREREVLQALISSAANDPRAYFYLAKNLMDAGVDPQRVIDLAQKGLSLKPDREFESFGYYLLADTYESLGMKDRARNYLHLAEKGRL